MWLCSGQWSITGNRAHVTLPMCSPMLFSFYAWLGCNSLSDFYVLCWRWPCHCQPKSLKDYVEQRGLFCRQKNEFYSDATKLWGSICYTDLAYSSLLSALQTLLGKFIKSFSFPTYSFLKVKFSHKLVHKSFLIGSTSGPVLRFEHYKIAYYNLTWSADRYILN